MVLESAAQSSHRQNIQATYQLRMTFGSWRSPYCPDPAGIPRDHAPTSSTKKRPGCRSTSDTPPPGAWTTCTCPADVIRCSTCTDICRLTCQARRPIALFLSCYAGALEHRQACWPRRCAAPAVRRHPGRLAGDHALRPGLLATISCGSASTTSRGRWAEPSLPPNRPRPRTRRRRPNGHARWHGGRHQSRREIVRPKRPNTAPYGSSGRSALAAALRPGDCPRRRRGAMPERGLPAAPRRWPGRPPWNFGPPRPADVSGPDATTIRMLREFAQFQETYARANDRRKAMPVPTGRAFRSAIAGARARAGTCQVTCSSRDRRRRCGGGGRGTTDDCRSVVGGKFQVSRAQLHIP